MELSLSTEPWTTAVAWARPWRGPAARRNPVAASRVIRTRPDPGPADLPPAPAAESAWTAAFAAHRAAREALAAIELGPEPCMDGWSEALARQDAFRARRELRRAQEALTGADADLPWSSC